MSMYAQSKLLTYIILNFFMFFFDITQLNLEKQSNK